LGAWAPKAEQTAAARYLEQKENVQNYLHHFKGEVSGRLNAFYDGFMKLKKAGHKVDAISPQAAIYLTVKLELHGMKKDNGEALHNTKEITKYILEEAKVAIVPFYAFGDSDNSPWYRLSVGTCRLDEVEGIINSMEAALEKLNN
jgi:aspartate aminotransferase